MEIGNMMAAVYSVGWGGDREDEDDDDDDDIT